MYKEDEKLDVKKVMENVQRNRGEKKKLTNKELYIKIAPSICKTKELIKTFDDLGYFYDKRFEPMFGAYKTLTKYTKAGLVSWDRPESPFVVTMFCLKEYKDYIQSYGHFELLKSEIECIKSIQFYFYNIADFKSDTRAFYTTMAFLYNDMLAEKTLMEVE